MLTTENWISIAGAAVSLGGMFVAIVSARRSEASAQKANLNAEIANRIAERSNELSERANLIAYAQSEAALRAGIDATKKDVEDLLLQLSSLIDGRTKLPAADTRRAEELRKLLFAAVERNLNAYETACRLHNDDAEQQFGVSLEHRDGSAWGIGIG